MHGVARRKCVEPFARERDAARQCPRIVVRSGLSWSNTVFSKCGNAEATRRGQQKVGRCYAGPPAVSVFDRQATNPGRQCAQDMFIRSPGQSFRPPLPCEGPVLAAMASASATVCTGRSKP